MAKRKVFTDESLSTFVDETKAYVDFVTSTKLDTTDTITNDEIDEICSVTMNTYLNSIASEEVSF